MDALARIVATATMWGLLGSSLCLLSGSASGATALQVSPLRIEFLSNTPSTTISVKNRGDSPSLIQVQIFRWTQQNGQDVLEPTRDILISPPVFTVKPNGEQLLRALVRIKPSENKEIAYRLLLREVADQANPDPMQMGVRVLLGFSLPIFIDPVNKVQSRLVWQARKIDSKKVAVSLKNAGDKHIQVNSFQLRNAEGDIVKQAQMAYVLPDNQREWVFDLDANTKLGSDVQIVAKTDNGELREQVPLEQP